MKKQKLSSLLPIAVFLIFYLGLGIWSEYIMKIPMGFYNIPIVVAFMLAILTACFQNRSLSFDRKLEAGRQDRQHKCDNNRNVVKAHRNFHDIF